VWIPQPGQMLQAKRPQAVEWLNHHSLQGLTKYYKKSQRLDTVS
jgi:hypothetical protein